MINLYLLVIVFPSKIKIGGFRIWNYNKSLIESVKGIREIEFFVNDDLKMEWGN